MFVLILPRVNMVIRFFLTTIVALGIPATVNLAAEPATRGIPHALPSHPGNIFLSGENVVVPAGKIGGSWRANDYEGNTVGKGDVKGGVVDLGRLPVGYYEVIGTDTNFQPIHIGVLEPLRAPTPIGSPIGIDVAMAWMYPPEKMAAVASLCQLAGMDHVRDRLMWSEIESNRGSFAASNRYDLSLQVQNEAGLRVLQLNHTSPPWANPDARRMPLDLRDIYNSYREFARRWRGEIVAFEPWNEADIKEFGAHTGNEMASLQKAAWFGLKAGNPDLIVCQNVFNTHRQTTLHNFNDNRPWPYFDTFNLHAYEPLAEYPKVYADFRAVAAGKPLWVTECSVTVDWSGDEQLKELSPEAARMQAERVGKIYAQSIHEGAQAVFYFMLPHYTERQIQYGLLHPDLTPGPGYVAAAAAGRLLAGAKPLGQINADEGEYGFLFDAKPDGDAATVLVIWADSEDELKLPKSPVACFDLLGRQKKLDGNKVTLTPAPLYLVFKGDTGFKSTPSPKPDAAKIGKPCPIVMQALEPADKVILVRSAYKVATGKEETVPIMFYNFGTNKTHGHLELTTPADCAAEFPKEIEIAPGERKQSDLKFLSKKDSTIVTRVQIKGDFGEQGESVLALRLFSVSE